MKNFNLVSIPSDPKSRKGVVSLITLATFICGFYFLGTAFFANDFKILQRSEMELKDAGNRTISAKCKNLCRPPGSGGLPEGILAKTSDLHMRPLWGSFNDSVRQFTFVFATFTVSLKMQHLFVESLYIEITYLPFIDIILIKQAVWSLKELSNYVFRWSYIYYEPFFFQNHSNRSVSLLAIAAGIKQKYLVNKIITKFLENGFVVMVFHYDGFVDQWYDLQWASNVIHVSAMNQTKWWFAKRFLHPDIVAEYDYVFLWDEDLDIEHFDPGRYVSIIKEEELDISQPALDPGKSEVHHQITVRRRNSKVHRKYIKLKGGGRCYDNSTGPPCFGWVEMMAPVFSKAAWRCAWYLIQNDLIHGWGIDFQLGYCAQGDRKQKVGVVDAEYIVHLGVPSLGGLNHSNNSDVHTADGRSEVRRQSYTEMRIFRRRWDEAVKTDKCWVDRYADHDRSKKKCVSGAC
ncbi:uncharacterized protein LOC112506753 isoform X2 [Cynara cardunculus var. scolymus]|uniref:uncharacterized protein LOC112506753 isoform X2 n=1 Tax=Cynara cardunculus var. scolymus TaxID=59895 RepID=UPI000D62A394|nr:uncharacterized protein LOC112506753 isoform X2 [Cynara cardunculus var. scolymus]